MEKTGQWQSATVTKITKKKYSVMFYPGVLPVKWKDFRVTRERAHLSNSLFEKCFICGHQFQDEETPVMINVSGEGNLFSCQQCCDRADTGESTGGVLLELPCDVGDPIYIINTSYALGYLQSKAEFFEYSGMRNLFIHYSVAGISYFICTKEIGKTLFFSHEALLDKLAEASK